MLQQPTDLSSSRPKTNHPINLSAGAARTACPSLWSLNSHWPFLMQHIPTQASPRCHRHSLGQQVCWEPGFNSCIYLLLYFTWSFCSDLLTSWEIPDDILRIPNTNREIQELTVLLTSPVCWSQFLMPPVQTILFFFKKKISGLRQHRSFYLSPRLFALEQGSKSIFAGVHLYIKLRKLQQNSALEGERVQDKRKGQEKDRTHSLLYKHM